MTLSVASIRDEIKMELGHPTVRVDLDDSVFEMIVHKAWRWFRAKKGIIKFDSIMLLEGYTEYDWPADCEALVDVIVPRRTDISDILSLGFFDIVPAQFVATASTFPTMQSAGTMRFDMGAYVQLLQSLEMRRRIFSGEPDWMEDRAGKKILLTNRNPVGYSIEGTQLYMVVQYKTNNPQLSDIFGRDEDLFYRYCSAKAKIVLGTIRSKFGSYPAAGGPIAMDGEALKTEGYAELAKLDEEIDGSQGNAGGIVIG
jgi:hypothetical protein